VQAAFVRIWKQPDRSRHLVTVIDAQGSVVEWREYGYAPVSAAGDVAWIDARADAEELARLYRCPVKEIG
jgi:hypothetical protein